MSDLMRAIEYYKKHNNDIDAKRSIVKLYMLEIRSVAIDMLLYYNMNLSATSIFEFKKRRIIKSEIRKVGEIVDFLEYIEIDLSNNIINKLEDTLISIREIKDKGYQKIKDF